MNECEIEREIKEMKDEIIAIEEFIIKLSGRINYLEEKIKKGDD